MDKEKVLEKAQGCLIGLACGDALGDLGRSDPHRQRYGIATNIVGEAKSTDDTEFAVLTARILLNCKGELTLEAVLDGWQKYILDQGGMFDRGGKPLYGAVENLKRGMLPPLSGQYNVNNNDDGAAMRSAPFGIVAAGNPDEAARLAAIDAQVSHYKDGIWAAQAVAASVAVAMDGADAETIWKTGLNYIPEDSWLGYTMDKAMQICEKAGSIESAWEELHTQLWTPAHSMSAEALPQIYAIYRLTGSDFERSMFWACNFGRDADTIGAVVGAFGGALHGLSAIPENWTRNVITPSGVCLKFAADENMLDLASGLVELIK